MGLQKWRGTDARMLAPARIAYSHLLHFDSHAPFVNMSIRLWMDLRGFCVAKFCF